jgi:hypothetical protein
MSWQRSMSTIREADDPYYGVMRLIGDGMGALRTMFPDGEANDMNFVLFSTSGVHGTYCSIEAAEKEAGIGVTFLVVHPRIVSLRYGNCEPKTPEDFAFLKKLRESSWRAAGEIGKASGE